MWPTMPPKACSLLSLVSCVMSGWLAMVLHWERSSTQFLQATWLSNPHCKIFRSHHVFVISPQTRSSKPGNEFESVELGVLDKREGGRQREKVPRRIIHFSSGETMEEYSTDEEEGEDKEPERKDLLSSPIDRVRKGGGMGECVCGYKSLRRVCACACVLAQILKCLFDPFCVVVKADVGSILLVSHVESCYFHYLRFVYD